MRAWAWFAGGLAVSVLVTALWWATVGPALFGLLFLPFLFWPRRDPTSAPRCEVCGRVLGADLKYCPYDGNPLP